VRRTAPRAEWRWALAAAGILFLAMADGALSTELLNCDTLAIHCEIFDPENGVKSHPEVAIIENKRLGKNACLNEIEKIHAELAGTDNVPDGFIGSNVLDGLKLIDERIGRRDTSGGGSRVLFSIESIVDLCAFTNKLFSSGDPLNKITPECIAQNARNGADCQKFIKDEYKKYIESRSTYGDREKLEGENLGHAADGAPETEVQQKLIGGDADRSKSEPLATTPVQSKSYGNAPVASAGRTDDSDKSSARELSGQPGAGDQQDCSKGNSALWDSYLKILGSSVVFVLTAGLFLIAFKSIYAAIKRNKMMSSPDEPSKADNGASGKSEEHIAEQQEGDRMRGTQAKGNIKIHSQGSAAGARKQERDRNEQTEYLASPDNLLEHPRDLCNSTIERVRRQGDSLKKELDAFRKRDESFRRQGVELRRENDGLKADKTFLEQRMTEQRKKHEAESSGLKATISTRDNDLLRYKNLAYEMEEIKKRSRSEIEQLKSAHAEDLNKAAKLRASEANAYDAYAKGLPAFVMAVSGDDSSFKDLILCGNEACPEIAERLDLSLRMFKNLLKRPEENHALLPAVHDIGRHLYAMMAALGYDGERQACIAYAWSDAVYKEGGDKFSIYIPVTGTQVNLIEVEGGQAGEKIREVRGWGVKNDMNIPLYKAVVKS